VYVGPVSRQLSDLDRELQCWHRHTSPRRASEDDCLLQSTLQPLLKHFEYVAVNPEDLLGYTVHLGIVLSASQGFFVLLHGEDLVPSSRKSKRDGITASSSKAVNNYILLLGCCGNIVGDFSIMCQPIGFGRLASVGLRSGLTSPQARASRQTTHRRSSKYPRHI
jgi:hypothetical protein